MHCFSILHAVGSLWPFRTCSANLLPLFNGLLLCGPSGFKSWRTFFSIMLFPPKLPGIVRFSQRRVDALSCQKDLSNDLCFSDLLSCVLSSTQLQQHYWPLCMGYYSLEEHQSFMSLGCLSFLLILSLMNCRVCPKLVKHLAVITI